MGRSQDSKGEIEEADFKDMKDRCVVIAGFYDGGIDGARTVADEMGLFPAKSEDEEERGVPYVISADRGYDIAERLGIRTDLLVGDLDSLAEERMVRAKARGELPETVRVPVEKDFTDLRLALEEARKRGFSRVDIIGGIGGRPDMTISNIQDMAGFAKYFSSVTMTDENSAMEILEGPGSTVLRKDRGESFSIFSLSERSKGVSEKGSYYPLDDSELRRDFPLGVSNRILSDEVRISVEKGTLLIVQLRKEYD